MRQMIPRSHMAHRLRTSFANRGTVAVVLLLPLPAILPTNSPAALARTALGLALANHQASPELHPNDKLTLHLLAPAASPGAKRFQY